MHRIYCSMFIVASIVALLFASCGPPMAETSSANEVEIPVRTVTELQQAIQSNEWTERSDAILDIQRQNEKSFTAKLIQLISTDPSPAVRQIALLTLADWHVKQSLPVLIQLLNNPRISSTDSVDPTFLLDAATRFPDASTAVAVARYLNDDDLSKRLYAVRALEEIQSGGPTVLQMANSNNDSDKARSFAMALGKLKYKPAESYLLGQLKSPEQTTQAAAILALGRIGSRQSVAALVRILDSEFAKGRENSKEALLEIGAPNTADLVIDLIKSQRTETRFFAAEIAGRLPGPNTGNQLLSLFNENQPISSAPAAIALGYMKYEPARRSIEERLTNQKSIDREILAKSLGWIGNKDSLRLLIQVLNEDDGEGRYGAAWSLGVLDAKEALPDLEKAANSSDSKLASLAIEAIGGIGSPSSLKVLMKPARQPGLQVYAIDAIGQIQGQEALEALQKLGVDGNDKTAALAVQALANRHDTGSASALIAILRKTSTESPIAGQIYKALYQQTGERFTTKNQWLQWYEAKYQK